MNLPLSEQDAYDIIIDQLGGDAFAESPWTVEQWHPEGALFFHDSIDVNVVVTTWTKVGCADVTTYTDYQLANMEEYTSTETMRLETLGSDIVKLLSFLSDNHSPIASPVELAADYMRQVRKNGPTYMRNVAACWSDDGHYDLFEVRCEIQELHGLYETESDAIVETCRAAAVLAIEAFHAEIGDDSAATEHRSEAFDRIAGSPLDALATLVIRS